MLLEPQKPAPRPLGSGGGRRLPHGEAKQKIPREDSGGSTAPAEAYKVGILLRDRISQRLTRLLRRWDHAHQKLLRFESRDRKAAARLAARRKRKQAAASRADARKRRAQQAQKRSAEKSDAKRKKEEHSCRWKWLNRKDTASGPRMWGLGDDPCDGTSLVLCEANLSPATLEAALQSCRRQKKPAWFDPVSVAKAPRGCLPSRWDLAAPNCDELLAMLGKPPGVMLDWEDGLPSALRAAVVEALSTDSGFADRLLLSLGPRGCVLASRADVATSSSSSQREHLRDLTLDVAAMLTPDDARKLPLLHLQLQEPLHESGCELLWYRLLKPADTVRDVTGAGDALLAGSAAAFVAGWPLEEAIVAGMVAAHATLFVDGSVSPQLHPKLLPTLQSLLHARRSRL
eukprot:s474_g4.t1